jgi:hypothetical protein
MSNTIRYSHENTTGEYQLVANHDEVLGSYATGKLAGEALQNLLPSEWSIDDTRWAIFEIVPPGETVSGEFHQPESEDYSQNEAIFPD